MLKGLVIWLSCIIVLFSILTDNSFSQELKPYQVRIMFYNVENLFDIYDDPVINDNEFLPDGVVRWNYTRYNKKINSLYKTIIAVGEWKPPAVIGLCEVENRKVLEDLLFKTNLTKYDYGIVHQNSPDQRGIDVCLLFRKDCVDLIDFKYWVPIDISGGDFNSRNVLYAKTLIKSDTIHFIVNHWPSRRGGVLAAEGLREKVAITVKQKIDSLIAKNGKMLKLILMGDFNCTPDDRVLRLLINSQDPDNLLVNLANISSASGTGTYRYQGMWEMIDQILVTEGLLETKTGLYTDQEFFKVFDADFLLKQDPKYPGKSPFSTYKGYRYQGGYSDHLPVILDLNFRFRD